ncbi:Peptidyl-prolyl cis-trans isomerase ESS1 [Pseudozyma hubeiensis]|nr:Peptidyl-prolyl cis-trans isomerase ESS1 [Pseudozyma hubeiensis]
MSSQWEIRFSNSRRLPYFYDPVSQQSTWEIPQGHTEESVRSLPGAKYLDPANAPGGAADKPDKVRASHLLIKHAGSRRPSSWKENNITRSKQDAIEQLKKFEQELHQDSSKDKFASLASVHSDCSSARAGGDLGFFQRGQMQKPFEDAAFGLKVGELSSIVDTDSGVHLIYRTA